MMKITVGRDPFLAELNILQGVVERKNTIPILSRLALEAVASNRIRIKATDLDVGIETECDAQVEGQGITVVPAKKLFDIVRSLPNGEILLEQASPSVRRVEL
jgi:DNA polymerase-3 subunit beta